MPRWLPLLVHDAGHVASAQQSSGLDSGEFRSETQTWHGHEANGQATSPQVSADGGQVPARAMELLPAASSVHPALARA